MEVIAEQFDIEHLKLAHKCLHDGGGPYEIFILLKDKSTLSGVFDSGKAMLAAIETMDCDEVAGWYQTFNGIKPEVVVTNKLKRNPHALGNSDFYVYRFLLIDVDPIKLTGDAATEEEVRYATATKNKVVEWLTANGMAPALVIFTGSGYHVFVKVDCWPVTDNINFCTKQLLILLGQKFNDDNVIIDPVTHNAGRRTRVVGVMNRKGEDPDLWRISRMDAANPDVKGIQIEELKEVLVANNMSVEPPVYKNVGMFLAEDHDPYDFAEWLGSEIVGEHIGGDGHNYKHLSPCPNFGDDHTPHGTRCCLIYRKDGKVGFKCLSPHCEDVTLGDLMRKANEERGPYEGPLWAETDKFVIEDVDDFDRKEEIVKDETPTKKFITAEELQAGFEKPWGGKVGIADVGPKVVESLPPTDDFDYEAQDTGNGERLVKKYGNVIRWISETNEWVVWGKNGWRHDNSGVLMRFSKDIVKDIVKEARSQMAASMSKNGVDDGAVKDAKSLLKHAQNTGKLERRKAMIASGGYELGVHTNLNDWDADGWLLNVVNGVIDLRTQTFRERKQADMCLKKSPVVYDKDTKCPLWEAAMAKWSCGDESWVEYLQVAYGVTLTSDVSLQALFFNQGGGENGKDTFFGMLSYVLGTYCVPVGFNTFTDTKNHSEHRNDLAALAGAVRMIVASESSDGHSLDEGVIKAVTGGPDAKITCRQILGKPFNYTPQFKPWFMSNYEPVIKGGDWGIWRRVKKIPWDYTLTAAEKDPNFGAKLRVEAPGALNWALTGLKKYIAAEYKLPVCKRIEDATAQYRKDMDIISRFVEETLFLKPGVTVLAKSVYRNFTEWCKANGYYPMNSRRFHTEFKKRLGGKVTWRDVEAGLQYEGVGVKSGSGTLGYEGV